MAYLRRTVDHELDELVPPAPALALDGPKDVDKARTASLRATTTWFPDDAAQHEVTRADFNLSSVSPGHLSSG